MNEQPALEEVYRSNRKDCLRHGLVLDATGIGYEIQEQSGGFRIIVLASDAARARAEIGAYAREDDTPPQRTAFVPRRDSGWAGVIGYALVLSLGFVLQETSLMDPEWFEAGKTHAGAIRAGEVWRAVTALTLHSDGVHLTANTLAGGLIGLFAGQLLGSGLAWISILFAGAAGNLLNAWIRHAGHTSVGASTAVFASLGLIAAYSWILRTRQRPSGLARHAPIIGAVVLLSYLGTGGERTDVVAHVAGFVAGVLLGVFYGKLGRRIRIASRTQILLGISALVVLTVAWAIALK